MNRREFLKYSAAAGMLIAAREGIIKGVMAQAATGVAEVDKLTIWVVTDNYYDANEPESKITKRYRQVPGKSIHASTAYRFTLRPLTAERQVLVCSITDFTRWG